MAGKDQYWVVRFSDESIRIISDRIWSLRAEGTDDNIKSVDGPMSAHNAQIRYQTLKVVKAIAAGATADQTLEELRRADRAINFAPEELPQTEGDLRKDLSNALFEAIGLWEERNMILLASWSEEDKQSLVYDEILNLSGNFEDDGGADGDDYDNEPMGEEAFENSYIGNGGAPDFENM